MSQARAAATRQVIIAAAVEVFDEAGYGNTSLAEIIDRAGVTKGGFYYHFPSREDLAAGIIAHANEALGTALNDSLASPSPVLQNLIHASFLVAHLMRHDPVVRMGYQLRQAVNQVIPAGPSVMVQRREIIVSAVKGAVAQGDLNDTIGAEEVGHTIWAAILGTHLLASASDENIYTRLGEIWRVILAGTATPGTLDYLNQFVTRTEKQYALAEPSE